MAFALAMLMAADLAAADMRQWWPRLITADPKELEQALDDFGRLPKSDRDQIAMQIQSRGEKNALPSPMFNQALQKAQAQHGTVAIAETVFSCYRRNVKERRWFLYRLMFALQPIGDAFVPLAMDALEKEPSAELIELLARFNPASRSFHASLGGLAGNSDRALKERAVMLLGYLKKEYGTPESHASLQAFAAADGAATIVTLRGAAGTVAYPESELRRMIASDDFDNRRRALLELCRRFSGKQQELQYIAKALSRAQADWKGRAAPPPLTEDEWLELPDGGFNRALLALWLSHRYPELLKVETARLIVQSQNFCVSDAAAARTRVFKEIQAINKSRANLGGWTQLAVSAGFDLPEARELLSGLEKRLSAAEKAKFKADIWMGLKASCADESIQNTWRVKFGFGS